MGTAQGLHAQQTEALTMAAIACQLPQHEDRFFHSTENRDVRTTKQVFIERRVQLQVIQLIRRRSGAGQIVLGEAQSNDTLMPCFWTCEVGIFQGSNF